MTLLHFIRLLMRNAIALFIVPILLAGTVFFLTKDEEKKYVSKSRIYTGFASGYSIESQSNSRVDFFAVNNAFDNLINIIKARSTSEEASLRLMGQHLSLSKPDLRFINIKHFKQLEEEYPDDLNSLIKKDKEDLTFIKIKSYCNKTDTNYFQRLFTSEHPHYSIKSFNNFKAYRVQSSDILEMTFESNDPGICQNTLLLLSEIFMQKFASIRINQTDQVVQYFESQLRISANKLSKAEDKLLNFNQTNNIINYNEQTKNISVRKEELDKEYYELQMLIAASNAVVYSIEEKLENHATIKLTSTGISKLRNKLSEVSTKLAFLELPSVISNNNNYNSRKINEYKKTSEQLKEQLQAKVDSLILSTQSPEGVPVADLLKTWLENIVATEQNYAKQEVIQKRKLEFLDIYKTFAPLGATLKRIEREINVVEQEYLELLHSLSQAKLKQQNNLLSSGVRVIDQPDFPLKAEKSKRKILILAAGLFGFILVAFWVLVIAYINPNLQTPSKTAIATALEVTGVLPSMERQEATVNYNYIKTRLIEMWMQSLTLDIQNQPSANEAKLIGIGSSRESEGKSYTTLDLVFHLRKTQKHILYLTYWEGEGDFPSYTNDHNIYYNADKTYINIEHIQELIMQPEIHILDYDYIIIEFPPLNEAPYPQVLMQTLDAFYLVINANRAWSKADDFSLTMLKKVLTIQPKVFLNGVSLDVTEDYIGQIPKKRSKLRQTILKILRRQLFRKLFNKNK